MMWFRGSSRSSEKTRRNEVKKPSEKSREAMNWEAITTRVDAVKSRGSNLQKRLRGLRHRLTMLLAVIGPGLITSNVDNDAGGISTYTQAGAPHGYVLLWALIPMTI